MGNNDQTQQTPKKGSSAWLWAILAIVIVAAAAVVYFVWQGRSNVNTNAAIQNTNSSNTNTNVSVNTSDWQTYANTKYGYSLKYPIDWTATIGKTSGGSFSVDKAIEQVLITPPHSSLDFAPASQCTITVFQRSNSSDLKTWIASSNLYDTTGEGLHLLTQTDITEGLVSGLLVNEGGPNYTMTDSFFFMRSNAIIRFGYYKSVDASPQSEFQSYSSICKSILTTLSN